jgi:hypothetical protein
MCFYAFLFEADQAALQALCDRCLNNPAQGALHYHPLVPRVLLGVAQMPRINVGAIEQKPFWTPEIDVAFWVPLVAMKKLAGVSVAERIVWFLPYLFVDSPWAVASGREVYGFAKEQSTFQLPKGPQDAARFSVDTVTVKQYGPDAQAQVQRLLEVRRTDSPVVGQHSGIWGAVKEAATDVMRLLVGSDGRVTLPGPGLLVEAFQFLVHHEYPMVFLKQFRDVADGRMACYQAAVEAMCRISSFRTGGWLSGQYQLTVGEFASHPIVQELGLKGASPPALAAGYLEFDFSMEAGKELWRAGG